MADKRINQRLPGFWREDRHLSLFLAFLVLMTIFVPMVGLSRPGRIAIDLSFGLMLLSGAIATVQKRMLMYLTIALTIFNPLNRNLLGWRHLQLAPLRPFSRWRHRPRMGT